MILKNLIIELQNIAKSNPEKLDTHVGIYPIEELGVENPNDIIYIDNNIPNRVDINVQKFNGQHELK